MSENESSMFNAGDTWPNKYSVQSQGYELFNLPLPSILCLIDCLIVILLQEALGSPASVPFAYQGALPGTQCLNIAWGIHLSLANILDCNSRGCLIQADVLRL